MSSTNYVFNRWDDGTGFAAGRAVYGPNAWFGRTFDSGRPLMDYPNAYPRLVSNFNYVSAQNSYPTWDPLEVAQGYPAAPRLGQVQQGMSIRDMGIPGSPIGYQQVLIDANGRPLGGLPTTTPTFYRTGPIQSTYMGFAMPAVQSTVAYDRATARAAAARASNPASSSRGGPAVVGSGPLVTEPANAGALVPITTRSYGRPMQVYALEPGDVPVYGSGFSVQRDAVPLQLEPGVETTVYQRANSNPTQIGSPMSPRRHRRNPLTCALNNPGVPLGDVSHGMPPGTMSHKNAVESARYARKVAGLVGDQTTLPGWAEHYLSRARRDLGDVGHYLQHQGDKQMMMMSPDEMLASVPAPNPHGVPYSGYNPAMEQPSPPSNPGGYGYPAAARTARTVARFDRRLAGNPGSGHIAVQGAGGGAATRMSSEIVQFGRQMGNPSALPAPFQFATSNPAFGYGAAREHAQRVTNFLDAARNPSSYGSSYANMLADKIRSFDGMISNPTTSGYGFGPARRFATSVGQWERRAMNPPYGNFRQEAAMQHAGVSSLPQAFGFPAAQGEAMIAAAGRARVANPAYGDVGQQRAIAAAGVAALPRNAFGFPAGAQEQAMFQGGAASLPPQAFGFPAARSEAQLQGNPYGYPAARRFARAYTHENPGECGPDRRKVCIYNAATGKETCYCSGARVLQSPQSPARARRPEATATVSRRPTLMSRIRRFVNPSAVAVNPAGDSPSDRDQGARKSGYLFSGQRARMTPARMRNPGACCDACADGKPCTGCAIPNPGCGCGQKRI